MHLGYTGEEYSAFRIYRGRIHAFRIYRGRIHAFKIYRNLFRIYRGSFRIYCTGEGYIHLIYTGVYSGYAGEVYIHSRYTEVHSRYTEEEYTHSDYTGERQCIYRTMSRGMSMYSLF